MNGLASILIVYVTPVCTAASVPLVCRVCRVALCLEQTASCTCVTRDIGLKMQCNIMSYITCVRGVQAGVPLVCRVGRVTLCLEEAALCSCLTQDIGLKTGSSSHCLRYLSYTFRVHAWPSVKII